MLKNVYALEQRYESLWLEKILIAGNAIGGRYPLTRGGRGGWRSKTFQTNIYFISTEIYPHR